MTGQGSGVIAPTIEIVAPARVPLVSREGDAVDTALIACARARLEAMGWRVKLAGNVQHIDHGFAGSAAERARGLQQAFADPEVDVVMALRGGWGTARVLDQLDWQALARSQAVFVGLSDLTVFNLALLARCGKASWQGPPATFFARADDVRDRAFSRALAGPGFSLEVPASGDAFEGRGLLWGGNLTMILSLLATPWFPHIEGGILFVEDVNEPAWRIGRMLDQLAMAGVLGRQQALIVGDMAGCDRTAGSGRARFALADALADVRAACGIAVIEGLPFGHRPDTLTLPVGVAARVCNRAGVLTIGADAVPLPAETPHAQMPNAPLWWV